MTKLHNTAYLALAFVLSAAVLTGCGESRSTPLQDSLAQTSTDNSSAVTDASFVARFDPANNVIPYPDDLLFNGSTDGTLNIPADPTASDYLVKQALNALDGFSTTAPITAEFSAPIDSATVNGSTVRVFELTSTGPLAPTGVAGELTYTNNPYDLTADFYVSVSGTTLTIFPMKPLQASDLSKPVMYMVVLTDGIKSQAGATAHADLTYGFAKSDQPLVNGSQSVYPSLTDAQAVALEPVRQLVYGTESLAAAYTTLLDPTNVIADLNPADIVLSWTFSTQSVGTVLDQVYTMDNALTPSDSIIPSSVGSTPGGAADIYVGTLDVPYYLTDASNSITDPITKHWQGTGGTELTRYNPIPVLNGTTGTQKGTQTIPLLISIPNTVATGLSKPSAGWKVVIFQHGITGNRTQMLGIADTLAAKGYATVAIDLPLHGVVDTSSPFYSGIERTFDLDLITEDPTTGAIDYTKGGDGVIDSSGSHFVNLQYLLTSRDNLRQAVSDLFTLTNAIPSMDYDGGGADFDGNNIYFVGHSLGGIVGSVFLAKEPRVKDAVLAMPGGGIAKLLDGSPTFGPALATGLTYSGITTGSVEYESFLAAAQTVIDSGDPINYASNTPNGRGVLMFEVVGDATNPPDQVVPNNVWPVNLNGNVPSPTAGTTPLEIAMGLTQYSVGSTLPGTSLDALVEFSAGTHGSILDSGSTPTSNAVWQQMQSSVATFFNSNGTDLGLNDSSVVK